MKALVVPVAIIANLAICIQIDLLIEVIYRIS